MAAGCRELGAGLSAFQPFGCSSDASNPASPSSSGTGTGGSTCQSAIPAEAEGPFPGDGSNGPIVLNLTGSVRSDIRSSFGGLSGTADGGSPHGGHLTNATVSPPNG